MQRLAPRGVAKAPKTKRVAQIEEGARLTGISSIMKSRMGGRSPPMMEKPEIKRLMDLMETEAVPLVSSRHTGISFHPELYDRLLDAMGDASVVSVGHGIFGADECHRERFNLSKRIIAEKGITSVTIEADYLDLIDINKFVLGRTDINPLSIKLPAIQTPESNDSSDLPDPIDANPSDITYPPELQAQFDAPHLPFSAWAVRLWRNTHTLNFVNWLREYNDSHPDKKVSIHGTDCHRTMFQAARQVIRYAEKRDAELATEMKMFYHPFLRYETLDKYIVGLQRGIKSARSEVNRAFHNIRRNYENMLNDKSLSTARLDEEFDVLMNAMVVKDAEDTLYYMAEEDRLMSGESMMSWNLRDNHMVQAIKMIRTHLSETAKRSRQNHPMKTLIWGNNSHLLDESGAPRSMLGGMNMGEMLRNEYGQEDTYSIGMIPKSGFFSASLEMNAGYENVQLSENHFQSLEVALTHEKVPNLYMVFRQNNPEVVINPQVLKAFASREMFMRCVGPVYSHFEEERGHFTQCTPAMAIDAVVAINRCKPITPID